MKSRWLGFAGRGLTGAAVAAAIAVVPGSAQQNAEDCRCVDRDGNEIENCTCFRLPDVDHIVTTLGITGERPRLGISVDATQAERYDARGALVTDVLAGGPADDGGIREDDVITSVDGQSLLESLGPEVEADFDLDRSIPVQRLLAIARELEPGQEVEVEYLRDDQLQTTILEADDLSDMWGRNYSVIAPTWDSERFREQMRVLTERVRPFDSRSDEMKALGEREWTFRFDRPGDGEVRFFGRGGSPAVLGRYGMFRDGLELVEINPGLGAYFGVEEGVLVADIASGSGLGLRAGDVVLRVGERAVDSPEHFHRILTSYGEDEDITFHIRRDGAEMTVTGRLRD